MLIECVPNVSEGRRADAVEAMADAVRSVSAVRLLDYSSDATHHRTVFTFVGDRPALSDAVLALFEVAVRVVDLRTHVGAHPRIGAVDVVPFIPLDGATMADCVELARTVGAAVSARHGVPVYLYGEAAAVPSRRRLELVRRGGFEALPARMQSADGLPDFGAPFPHPTAGASAIGARQILIAYNVNLSSDRFEVAQDIARHIRESSGGLVGVKAIAVRLVNRGIVQVSTNVTDYHRTPLRTVYETIRDEAKRHGADVVESEIVGLAPRAAVPPGSAEALRIVDFSQDKLLETRLESTPR